VHRNADNVEGHSPQAAAANQMLNDLIFVLKYYRELNPQAIVTIENPLGYLHMTTQAGIFKRDLGLGLVTISYCQLAGACGLAGGKESDENVEPLPQKHTVLFTSSRNILHVCRDDALKCQHDCGARDVLGTRHQRGVYSYADRMAAYPRAFVEFLAFNLFADMRLGNRRKSDTSSSESSN